MAVREIGSRQAEERRAAAVALEVSGVPLTHRWFSPEPSLSDDPRYVVRAEEPAEGLPVSAGFTTVFDLRERKQAVAARGGRILRGALRWPLRPWGARLDTLRWGSLDETAAGVDAAALGGRRDPLARGGGFVVIAARTPWCELQLDPDWIESRVAAARAFAHGLVVIGTEGLARGWYATADPDRTVYGLFESLQPEDLPSLSGWPAARRTLDADAELLRSLGYTPLAEVVLPGAVASAASRLYVSPAEPEIAVEQMTLFGPLSGGMRVLTRLAGHTVGKLDTAVLSPLRDGTELQTRGYALPPLVGSRARAEAQPGIPVAALLNRHRSRLTTSPAGPRGRFDLRTLVDDVVDGLRLVPGDVVG